MTTCVNILAIQMVHAETPVCSVKEQAGCRGMNALYMRRQHFKGFRQYLAIESITSLSRAELFVLEEKRVFRPDSMNSKRSQTKNH